MSTILIAVIGAAVGLAIGWAVRDQKGKSDVASAEAKAADVVKKAEAKEQDVLLRAKDKAVKILEEARLEEKKALEDVKRQQASLVERENAFGTKLLEVDETKKKLEADLTKTEARLKEVEALKVEEVAKLEEVAGLRRDDAIERIMKLVEEQHEDTILSRMRKLDEMSQDEIDKKARNIIAVSVQRQASSHAHETLTSYVELPSDDMKGRVIGKEGRNIKAIESLTGCELVVDDTPGMITISGFSPIRRQVAKRALSKLLQDGRIHPGRIEEAVDEAKRDLAIDIKKAGEDALYELGISMAGIDPKLIQILGRLKYRTSYGQNALQHSMEVAKISTLMAEELGADVNVCRKGGLFHDIGKAVDHDMQGGHPELGYQIMKKFGFPEEICYQSIGHHEDKPKTVEAVIVKAADAISGARPGARKDSLEFYVKRLEELEAAASSFPGVEKVYAIQAGREIRVFVNPTQMDDLAAEKTARDIAQKIEAELKHPGEIRVTLIREKRVVEYAR
ncbi:MAG TPA: ribonuclease Y [Candidatus Methylomirabilis sp.]|nr:ribonuclease Y [Candidatus Methylomirabilis sp.]